MYIVLLVCNNCPAILNHHVCQINSLKLTLSLSLSLHSNKMQSISECFDEYHKRWRRVEHICGFQVCSSPTSPTSSSTSSQAHKYERVFFSTSSDPGSNSITSFTTLDGIYPFQGARLAGGGGGDVVLHPLHRSSTLPRFRSKSNSLLEADSYYNPKSRPSSVSSSSMSSGSVAVVRSFKSGSPLLNRQPSVESGGDGGGDVDIADCHQLVSNNTTVQHVSSQIQHHQLHHSSVGTSTSKRSKADIAELSESPRRQLKNSASVPTLVRKESYSEAVCNGEDSSDGESSGTGGITFTIASDGSNPFSTVSTTASAVPKAPMPQSLNENKQALKPPGYRTASSGLEAIKEERVSQISLASGGSSEVNSQGGSRAGSSSPEKPKSKSRSQSPRGAAVKSTAAINHSAISSDV